MKKFIGLFLFSASALLLLSGCTVSAGRVGVPLDNTIVQAGVGLKILPKEDSFSLLRIAPLWLGDDFIAVANVSAISTCETSNGVALGGILVAEDGCGVSAGLIDHNSGHIGIRLGGLVSGKQHGAQVGLFTYCTSESKAIQIGLLNFVEGQPYPLPFFNWSWRKSGTP